MDKGQEWRFKRYLSPGTCCSNFPWQSHTWTCSVRRHSWLLPPNTCSVLLVSSYRWCTHIFLFRQQCPARVHLSPLPLRPCFHYRGYQFTTVANLGCELAGIGMHPTGCLWRCVHRPWVWSAPRHRLGIDTQLEGGRGRKLESVRIIALCFPAGEQGSSTPLLPTPHCKMSATVSKTYPALTTWFLGVPLLWESVTNIVSH